MDYVLTAVIGFWTGVALTWLFARRLVLRAERMLGSLGDMLPREALGKTIMPPDPPRSATPPPRGRGYHG